MFKKRERYLKRQPKHEFQCGMDDICLKWCQSHTFLMLFAFPRTRGMLKKLHELAKRGQLEEYLCSSWKKYMQCRVGDGFQLSVAFLCEKWSRGAWQLLSTICPGGDCTMLWQQSFQTKTPEPAKYVSVISTWCSSPWVPRLLFLMECLLYKANDASFSAHHISVKKIIWLQSVLQREEVCFFPFQIHQQKTHEMKHQFCLTLDISFHNKHKW